MEYIDKHQNTNISRFNALIDGFIAQGKTHYKNLDAADRSAVRALLMGEQSNRCAFCMEAQRGGGTVEHVIPQGISLGDFANAYRQGNYYPQFVHQNSYTRSPQAGSYPHTLAYGNVVIACSSCNAKKWERVIKPSFFDNPPNVSYGEDGVAVFQPDDLDAILKTYLNERIFRKNRALWCAIKRSGLTVQQVSACVSPSSRLRLLSSIEPQMSRPLRELYNKDPKSFIKPNSWKSLLCFDWFWGYY